MILKSSFNDRTDFTGIYRGFVVWNDDPKVRGRIKVFVPGVYSDKYETQPANLPWARPFSPSFGGGSMNPDNADRHVLNDEVGWCSVPHAGDAKTGSQVFLFFENGDINYPVYFGVAQSDEGWFSEHPNQHCFRSDNIRVRIDENVRDPRSTCKFSSYSSHCSDVAKENIRRDCERFGWKFDRDGGQVEQLETRLDIEIEATGMNAVNLNIHGNVNMHIDGDWFVEHFGNKYEYQKGDLYVRHDGHTYIEETGHYRKTLSGNHTYEHTGNSVENQEGDTLVTRTGSYFSQIDNDVTHMYNSNYKVKVNGNVDEITGNDRVIEVGNGVRVNVGDSVDSIVGGHLSVGVGAHIGLDSNGNFELHSKSGNIMLKTDGEFELMEDGAITCEGFRNLGARGNIQLISTFGNINIQCVKNENLADFGKRSTVIPWSPEFVRQVRENSTMFPGVSPTANALKGMGFSTDVNEFSDFIQLMKDAQELLIYDGLPVFLPARMIVQNPNVTAPENADDLSWIPTFRDEDTDWRSVRGDVMWKLPGRLMGNISIETWSGDISVRTASELGCAGNIILKAEEKLGTFSGYRIGCISMEANGKERVYPDPRDLFLDSDFFRKNAGRLTMFTHGTNPEKSGPALGEGCEDLLRQTGYSYDFASTNYDRFYDMYGMNIVTKGFSLPLDKAMARRLSSLKQLDPPRLGCPKCISDYLLGVPMIQELFYTKMNVAELKGGYHMYGFQRLNPHDRGNPRGVFNVSAGDFSKISIGDGHAIGSEFMRRDFGSSNIGAMTFSLSGDLCVSAGRNQYKSLNLKNPDSRITESYEHVETPFDFCAPNVLKKFMKKMKESYESHMREGAIKVDGGTITLDSGRDGRPFEAGGGFRALEIMPELKWQDGGHITEFTRGFGGEHRFREVEDTRIMTDFGFDFERCKDLVVTMDAHMLEANFKEREMHIVEIDRGADREYHEGGSSRWFQIRNFGDPKMHVEISGSYNSHKYSVTDRNGQWLKSHDFHDQGFVWWDDQPFSTDLVPYFPDSEFDIESTEVDRLWDEINSTKGHHAWAKYGNHIKNDELHKDYNKPTSKCGGSHMVSKGSEPIVDTSTKLWGNKKGAGVRVTSDTIVTANQYAPHHFTLCTANCGKNQNIETSEVWNALTHIYQKKAKTAAKNLFNEEWYTADVTKSAISYKAAVNTNTLTLHSDHVALTPDEEKFGGTMGGFNDYTLRAGNLVKTELIGNQDYFNYAPGVKSWKHSGQYTNNYEITQNGFHKNSFKVLNGTDTKIPAEGETPEFAKSLTNELVISNGGYGDEESAPCGVTYYNPATGKGAQGTPAFPLSSNNYIFVSNGSGSESPEQNAFRLENGTGVSAANNAFELENGSANVSGMNLFRVDNQGLSGGGSGLKNSITLNNDNNRTNLILSDYYTEGEPQKAQSPIVSLYSLSSISSHAGAKHTVEAPTGVVKHNEHFFDSIESTVRTFSTSFDSTELNARVENVSASLEKAVVKSASAELNAASSVVKADMADFSASTLGVRTGLLSVDADQTLIDSNSITQVGTVTNILGQSISVLGEEVALNRVSASGVFNGHLQGSMDGPAMLSGKLYQVTKKDGVPVTPAPGVGVAADPQGPDAPEPPEPPEMNGTPNPLPNVANGETLEAESITLMGLARAIIRKFIRLELSLLDVMNGK